MLNIPITLTLPYTHSHILKTLRYFTVHQDYPFLHTDSFRRGSAPFSHSASQGHCHLRQQCDLSQGKQTFTKDESNQPQENPHSLVENSRKMAHATVGILSFQVIFGSLIARRKTGGKPTSQKKKVSLSDPHSCSSHPWGQLHPNLLTVQ